MRPLILVPVFLFVAGCPIEPTVNIDDVNVEVPVAVEDNDTTVKTQEEEPEAKPEARQVDIEEDAGLEEPVIVEGTEDAGAPIEEDAGEQVVEEDAGEPVIVEEDAGSVEADAGEPVIEPETLCEAGALACSDEGNSVRCAADGLSWVAVETCNEGCNEGLCTGSMVRPEGGLYHVGSAEPKTWADAEAGCVAWGGHLISINSSEEEAWLLAQATELNFNDSIWLGFTDSETETVWTWTDGSGTAVVTYEMGNPIETRFQVRLDETFTHWGANPTYRGNAQPDNGDAANPATIPGQDCAVATTTAWDDRDCGELHYFVCERAL